ncbi:MAG TPA: histidine phosphotransferase family protein [Micavibrio sp.]|jgi:histidine phosphotransferase ChpT|nr:histidine phosphotransferase family protein [Micavibrio sp.]
MTSAQPHPDSEQTGGKSSKSASVIELLASRICHDLVSPVGAINNGVEFMEEMGDDPEQRKEALGLIQHSASQASAKLMAFRIAYGAGGRDSNIKPEDVQKAFSQLISADGKISQTWDPFGNLGPKPLPYAFCKMLMAGMMLAMECLTKGGYVSVRPGEGNQTLIIAESDAGVLLRDNVEAALRQEIQTEDLDPRLVHPYAISVVAEHYGYNLRVKDKRDDRVTFALDCPAPQSA